MTLRSATDPIPAPARRRDDIRRDVLSAYVVTAARVSTWAIISAIVYRRIGRDAFAMLTLVRATVGLLSYASVGLSPAIVRKLAEVDQPIPLQNLMALVLQDDPSGAPPALDYPPETLRIAPIETVRRVYASGSAVSLVSAAMVLLVGVVYGAYVSRLHVVPAALAEGTRSLAILFAVAMAVRLLSEAPASLLQVRGRLALDNLLVAGSELVWLLATAPALLFTAPRLGSVGLAFLAGSLALWACRHGAVGRLFPELSLPNSHHARWAVARDLLAFGVGVAVAQAADFLYSPIDYILINRLIGAETVSVYAPALQLDPGLLLIVTGLAAALLPHSAVAHAAGDCAAVRRFYLRGTLLSLATLAPAAVIAWLVSPALFRLWLGSPMFSTRAILPLVLFSTVVGGSSAVGRSILLSMGKVRAFGASVVIAGLANVALSYAFVRYGGLGLNGIIYGTMVAVFVRCAIWMPWYVLRAVATPRR